MEKKAMLETTGFQAFGGGKVLEEDKTKFGNTTTFIKKKTDTSFNKPPPTYENF
jgi:hypothetical protein